MQNKYKIISMSSAINEALNYSMKKTKTCFAWPWNYRPERNIFNYYQFKKKNWNKKSF